LIASDGFTRPTEHHHVIDRTLVEQGELCVALIKHGYTVDYLDD